MARAGRVARRSAPAFRLSPAQARHLVRYNRAVFERYVRRLRKLPARRATRNRETGHLTWIATLSHIANVHEAWMLYIVPGRVPELLLRFRDDDRHPKDWPGLVRYARLVFDGVDRWAERVTPTELTRPVRAPWMPGEYTASDALLQSTFEQAHHLGEIIGTMWQDDIAPPAMTWIDVNRSRGRPA